MSALTLGLIAAVMWGFHDVCVRFVSQKTPLMASLLTVLVTGTLFHVGVMAFQQGDIVPDRAVLGMSFMSGVLFLVASLGLYGAFQRGPVALVAPIIASYPILSVAWAAWSGTHISPMQWGAVMLVVLGVSLVSALAQSGESDVPPIGKTISLAALSSVGFAGTFAFGQSASAIAGELPVTLVTRLVAIALLLAGLLMLRIPIWPGRAALPVLSLMGIADGIALLSVNTAGHLEDAQYASVSSSSFGLLTILFAFLFLKERLKPVQWLGCVIAFSAIGYLAL
ncbi:DMT family transporter [Planktotalea sp.]|uniref:DMT family transporter n=1 Tax=Planktotalea sp. TaxID=2029877 RepID=UPI00329A4FBC